MRRAYFRHRKASLLTACLLSLSLSAAAQMWDQLAADSYRIDKSQLRVLRAEVDALAFFRDNEYSSALTKGYSLPGLWVRPKLLYTPLSQVEVELGAHALIFDGANKYPCYVYHDIGRWKGQQYQHGAHALPWLRAKAEFRHLTVVMGDIYGAQNHRLGLPLWNPEGNLSQDPEMGFQLLWDKMRLARGRDGFPTRSLWRFHMDTWLNWQSYIFEEDSHQEAFTVGSTWEIGLCPVGRAVSWYMPLQLVIQHRGGEQDTTALGVQTLCNAAAGAGMRWTPKRQAVERVTAEASVLATYQQSGHLWPFDSGIAYHATASTDLRCGLSLGGGFFRAPRHFVSLYGNHFFSTLSVRDGESHQGVSTAHLRADFHHTFATHYVLGAEAEAYQTWLGGSAQTARSNELNFSFGIYLRINPQFKIKKF